MVLEPGSGAVTPFADLLPAESFKGLNDLVFAGNGDLYFTDQGKTGLHDPTGRVYRFTADGHLQALIETLPGPNGLVLSPDEKVLYVGSRANAIWWQPLFERAPACAHRHLRHHARPRHAGRHGGRRGGQRRLRAAQHGRGLGVQPDRPADLADRDLRQRQAHQRRLWRARRKDLYVLDGNGKILVAHMPVAGLTMYAHR